MKILLKWYDDAKNIFFLPTPNICCKNLRTLAKIFGAFAQKNLFPLLPRFLDC